MVKNKPVTSHLRNNTFINRAKPEQKHAHDPGLKTIKMVENELRENNFFTSKNSLWRSLPKQTQYPTFCKALDYLEESNKITYDKDGNIIWIFVESKKAQKSLDKSMVLNLSRKTPVGFGGLSVSSRDVGVDCDYVARGETEQELMDNLIEHAIREHGYTREDVLKPEMHEVIKAHIQSLGDSSVLNLSENTPGVGGVGRTMTIIASILQSANNPKGVDITTIMYKSFLSHSQLNIYLSMMLENDLIKLEDEHLYKITEKGLTFLEFSSNAKKFFSNVNKKLLEV